MQTTELMGLPYLEVGDHVEDIANQSKQFVTGVESVMLSNDFRGLPGDQGGPGPRGLPGINAVPADEAVAAYLTATDTATRTAADARYGDAATAALVGDENTATGAVVRALASGSTANDESVARYFADSQSLTSAALVTSPAADALRDQARAKASHQFGEYLGKMYVLVRAGDAGPTPGLITKRFGGSTLPGVGTSCVPQRETLDVYAARALRPLIFNASGWKVSGNVGEARGAQIFNGAVFHDFEDINASPAGIEAIGIRKNGTVGLYSALDGDTAEIMVADGVDASFSYGPILVRDGAVRPLTDPRWTYFADSTISARQIIGTDTAGTFMVCTVEGVSGSSGLTGPQSADLARSLGFHQAILMDGGGSAQAYAHGYNAMPSTDAGGRRAVPDALCINAELIDPGVDTGWWDVGYVNGYVASSQKLQIRERGGTTYMQGDVKPATGNFGVAADVTVATIRSRFRHSAAAKPFIVVGNGENVRKATVSSSGAVGVVAMATSATPPYLNLGNITWSK